jgi:L-threonylcarbamoyladenylate synthase
MIVPLKIAVQRLKKGEVVAFPTETVYGLGAAALNPEAVKETFRVKGRPSDNPLIVHISSRKEVYELAAEIPDDFNTLADKYWPGPITFVLKKKSIVPDIVTAGLDTVAVRMPDHPTAIELLRKSGPLTAPSANPSGKPSPTKASHVLSDYEGKIPVLDGGPTLIGVESTVIDLSGNVPAILRPGAITEEMIRNTLNREIQSYNPDNTQAAKSPGVKYTHYKPNASVHWLNKIPAKFNTDSLYVFHSDAELPEKENIINYRDNYTRMARELYDIFRMADRENFRHIYIQNLEKIKSISILSALKNRIEKAIGA